MKSSQFNIPRYFSSARNISVVKKANSEKTVFHDKISVKLLRTNLQKANRVNNQLEKTVLGLNKELSEVKEKNAKFMSVISHDMRSPLNTILGLLETIKSDFDDNDLKDTRYQINTAIESTTNAVLLLNSLLDWATSQNNLTRIEPVNIDLHSLLKDETNNVNITAVQKNITIKYSVPENLRIKADLQMIKTIMRNLINNSIKYTTLGGEINICAYENKQYVDIAIIDNGVGISLEDQEKLFENGAFYSKEGTHNEKGVGIGLLLCKEFVENHGGKILLDSVPGKGTEFKVRLPQY